MAYADFSLVFHFLIPALVGGLCWIANPLPAGENLDHSQSING